MLTIKTSFFLLVFGFLFSLNPLTAQEERSTPKNSIYATVGTLVFVSNYSFSYERVLTSFSKGSLSAKVNYGQNTQNNFDSDTGARITDNHLSLSGVYRLKVLEITFGAAYERFTLARGFDPEPDVDYSLVQSRVSPYVSAGIRYDAGPVVLRAGIGNYEFLYAGIGVTF